MSDAGKERVVTELRLASLRGVYDGRNTPWARRYIAACSAVHEASGTRLIFTRDSGAHSGGWWKNPDYELCKHLSLSFIAYDWGRRDYGPRPQDRGKAAEWCELFFGRDACRLLWVEPPFTPEGKAADVFHYRLFCDQAWVPIKPRGEVYSRHLTEAGWKSWSDIHGAVDNGDGDFGADNAVAAR
jgi:hypothetical protein